MFLLMTERGWWGHGRLHWLTSEGGVMAPEAAHTSEEGEVEVDAGS
jgi:hypothetical protein